MELTGKLSEKLPIQSGISKKTQKEWKKIGFVLSIEGKYPKSVHVESLNSDVIQMITDTSLETVLNCEIDISSRSWTNPNTQKTSWFTGITAWKVEVNRDMGNEVYVPNQQVAQPEGADDDLPF